jgi:5-hydroxyisourate hydrolase-like protein (transthyretin family)
VGNYSAKKQAICSRSTLGRLPIILVLLGLGPVVFAQVSGTVTNGTTGKPIGGVEVHLVKLEGGMQVVGKTTTDAQGRFSFATEASGSVMVRATYEGVNYHEMYRPGEAGLTLRVFETATTGSYSVDRMTYLVQQSGDRLLIAREFTVRNDTSPPVTLQRSGGVFRFRLPDGVTPERTSAVGANGMPIPVAARSSGNGLWTIDYPLRPGETRFFTVSTSPYKDRQASLSESLAWDARSVLLYVPQQMTVTAPGFQSLGTEQGLAVYGLTAVKAGTTVAWSVSGTAPPMGSSEADDASPRAGEIQIVPGPINERGWLIVVSLAALFAAGSLIAVRRSGKAGPPPAGKHV